MFGIADHAQRLVLRLRTWLSAVLRSHYNIVSLKKKAFGSGRGSRPAVRKSQ